jgi:hypothetical protein
MIELVMTVCSLLAGQKCTDKTLTFEAQAVSLMGCSLYGQFAMAQWSEEHPNWSVVKWRCRPAGEFGKA